MVMGVVIGFVGKMGEEGTVNAFIDGARDMLGVALVVAVARGISVVMTNGLIIDTVLYWCEQALSGLISVAFINTIFLLYIPLSFLIPSSSGLGDRDHADHGAVGRVRRYSRAPHRHSLPVGIWVGKPRNPDLRGCDRWSGDRPDQLRSLVEIYGGVGPSSGHSVYGRAVHWRSSGRLKNTFTQKPPVKD